MCLVGYSHPEPLPQAYDLNGSVYPRPLSPRLRALQVSQRGGELYCEHRGERVGIAGRAVAINSPRGRRR
jgi:hypothetical protein